MTAGAPARPVVAAGTGGSPGPLVFALALLAGLTLWRLVMAALLPPILDEAYYFDWARTPAPGYFDHPPAVAWLGAAQLWAPTGPVQALAGWLAAHGLPPATALIPRLGAVLAGALTGLVLWRVYRAAGLIGRDLRLALVLAVGTIPGLIVGVITTPDTVLALAWALALHEALAALQRDRRRWVTAGLATGLGLLGKYTMLLIGPVFLFALLVGDRRALATRWPWLGGLAALAVITPHLLWLAGHDWLTLRFQFGHGFATTTGALAIDASALPAVVGPGAYAPVAPAPLTGLDRLTGLGGFLVAQAGFWGLLLVPIALRLVRRTGPRARAPATAGPAGTPAALDRSRLDPAARALLGAAALFPLGLFGLLALASDVEPNWPAMYLAGAVPFVALWLGRSGAGRAVPWAAGLNLLLISLYAVHGAGLRLPLPDAAERILRETQGYAELAAHAATLPGPVFADRYQVAAMLNFHQPGLDLPQWPGVTRPSEYSRGVISAFPSLSVLREQGFWLVARRLAAPDIPGFAVAQVQTAFACKGAPLALFDRLVEYHDGPCAEPLRVWRLYRYRPMP